MAPRKRSVQELVQDQSVTPRKKVRKVQPKRTRKENASGELQSNAFDIVPWVDTSDWDRICRQFKMEKYDDVLREMTVWRERIPALPVGAEATVNIVQAALFDRTDSNDSTPDLSRSLYSLAVVRFMNLISQLATKETGGSAPMSRLASAVNVPEWIVDLRHEISHGAALPSLGVLRSASDFILEWLASHYWVYSDESAKESAFTNEITLQQTEDDEVTAKEERSAKISLAIAHHLAAKIYKMRGLKKITDRAITQHLHNLPESATPKQVVGETKTALANLFTQDPSLFCRIFAQEMIPTDEFINGFSALTQTNVDNVEEIFDHLNTLWRHLVDLMKKRSRIPMLCTALAKALNSDVQSKRGRTIAAMWLDHLLELLEEDEKKYPLRLKKILILLLKNPDPIHSKFIPRLLSLLENNLGTDKVDQLRSLYDIWTDDSVYMPVGNRSAEKMFCVEDLTGETSLESPCQLDRVIADEFRGEEMATDDAIMSWQISDRGQNFWRRLPLGQGLGIDLL